MDKPKSVTELAAYLEANPFVHMVSVHVEDAGPRKFTHAGRNGLHFTKSNGRGDACVPTGPCRPCPAGPEFSFDNDGFVLTVNKVALRYFYIASWDDVPLLSYQEETTVREVLGAANAACCHLFDESSFSETVSYLGLKPEMRFDEYAKGLSFVTVYAVRGGSEGHYVHIDMLSRVRELPDGTRGIQGRPLGMCKTFRGLAHAELIAATARRALVALID